MPYWQNAGLAIIACVLVTACGRAVSVSPPSPPLPSPSASAGVSAVACIPTDLTLTLATVGGAAGRDVGVFVFTNASSAPCSLIGYPGLQLLDSASRPVSTQVTDSLDSSFGADYSVAAIQPVNLNPGGTAKFSAEWATQVGACIQPSGFAVIPPNTTAQLVAASRAQSNPGFNIIVCDARVTVHPVVPATP
jgi:uncharacterized protein DUF4232